MRRRSALHWAFFALFVGAAISQDADPCKRQPFRGRCPASGAGQPQRSQFVLRYYLRNGECVSYPYGHCANDENEPKLFRYKEECEDACIGNPQEEVATTVSQGGQTYATVSPDEQTTVGTAAEGGQSECQKQREQRGSARIHGGFVPECTSEGKFRPLQCEPDGRSCFCVTPDGIEVPNSRATVPEQPKPNCDQIDQHRPATTKEPQSSAESDSCLGGASPLEGPDGRPIDCARTDCPVGYKCSVGARRSICCKDDQKTPIDANELHSGVAPQLCTLPKERGPCDRYELRFYYHRELKECKYFFYGGCEGNENNFNTIDDCKRTCGAGPATKATPAPTKGTPPQLSTVENGPTTSSVVETSRTETTAVWTTAGSTPPEAEDIETTTPTNPPTEKETTAEETTSTTKTVEEVRTTPQTLVRFTDSTGEPTTSEDASTSFENIPTTAESSLSTERQQQTEEQRETEGVQQTEGQQQTEAATRAQEETVPTSQSTESSSESFEQTTERIRTAAKTLPPPPPSSLPRQRPAVQQQTRPTTQRSTTTTTTAAPLPEDRCDHPRDSGSCGGRFDRWYWNADKRICESFAYSGCGGNGNNWGTREECLATCSVKATSAPAATTFSPNICEHAIDEGDCGGSFARFGFDRDVGECREFTYTGCGGNGNNFGNLKDCQRRCQAEVSTLPPNVCEHPVDKGECTGSFTRFAYDSATNECNSFVYTGCGGNGNNHGTREECLAQCAKDLPPIPADCPPLDVNRCVEPCIIFSNRLGCQECVCPVQPPTRATHPPRSEAPIPPPGSIDTPQIHHQPAPPSPPSPPGAGLPPSPERMAKKPPTVPVARTHPNVVPKPEEVPAPPPAEPQFPNLGEKCTQHVDPGPCTNFVERWHFNPARGECEPFQYGGCAGNRNHFYTANECNLHCARFLEANELPQEAPQPPRQPTAAPPQPTWRPAFPQNPQPPAPQRPSPPPPTPVQEVEFEPADLPQQPVEQPSPFRPESPPFRPESPVGRQPQRPPMPAVNRELVDTEPKVAAHGLPNAPVDINNPNFVGPQIPDFDSKQQLEEVQKIPVCPNGLKAMHYSDGRPIMCLPGKNQCPDSSVCYFNGLDFYCCPNEEDPYDQHIFGGYDGEEVKHGYKNRTDTLSIRSTNTLAERRARHRREAPTATAESFARRPLPPTSFSLDHVSHSLRFDEDRAPHRISQAARINPCTQPIPQTNGCENSHLRYFYDIDNDDCRVFLGCEGGSENQFLTKEHCEKRCKLGPILSARPPASTTTNKPTPAGHCPGGKTPLGDNAPVLCGNQTDSIGCPPGYFCRFGPPDVCCPEDVKFDLGRVLSTPSSDIRRKPFVSSADKSADGQNAGEKSPAQLFIDDSAAFDISAGAPGATPSEEPSTSAPTTTIALPWEFLTPPNMCPDGSDALTNSAGEAMICGSGFDGHKLCPRGYYCSIDRERNSRLCCKLDIQSSNIPNPAPQIAPYLGVRRANPGEAIERPSLPSDQRFATFRRAHRVL